MTHRFLVTPDAEIAKLQRARHVQPRHNAWTEMELARLKRLYPRVGFRAVPTRSTIAVYKKANELGLVKRDFRNTVTMRVWRYLLRNKPCARADLAIAVGASRNDVGASLRALQRHGRIAIVGVDRYMRNVSRPLYGAVVANDTKEQAA